VRSWSAPCGELEEIAADVFLLPTGRALSGANVYFLRSGSSWVVVDASWPNRGAQIARSAALIFGVGARPATILLTHLHPDHAGSALELAERWDVPVNILPDELALAPLGPAIGTLARVERRWLFGSKLGLLSPLDPRGAVPGLPDWRCIPTPGHTPGHAAFFRERDRVLVSGDAVLSVNLNSLHDMLTGRHAASPPPRLSTWSWQTAGETLGVLARLEPEVLAPGHGPPLAGPEVAAGLHALATRRSTGVAEGGRGSVRSRRRGEGFLQPVDYSRRVRYRRPPDAYLRMQWIASPITRLGFAPKDVITLEVPGRRTGVIRRTTLLQATSDGRRYLVALAGESEWVRNVRAAGGRVVIGRRERRAATLRELPEEERAPVIRSYLLRWGRTAGSRAVAREARRYFGVSADPSCAEIELIVEHYPVFRIDEDPPAAAAPSEPAPPISAG
jgi:deazaflavin-dependent oxidoreductase (nitroreductase family)